MNSHLLLTACFYYSSPARSLEICGLNECVRHARFRMIHSSTYSIRSLSAVYAQIHSISGPHWLSVRPRIVLPRAVCIAVPPICLHLRDEAGFRRTFLQADRGVVTRLDEMAHDFISWWGCPLGHAPRIFGSSSYMLLVVHDP